MSSRASSGIVSSHEAHTLAVPSRPHGGAAACRLPPHAIDAAGVGGPSRRRRHGEDVARPTSADTATDGWTPLIWATRAGRIEVMTLLLDAGADPNRRDSRQAWTPLMHAQHVKQDGAARLLLARGADGTAGADGTSPLEMASLDNDVEMLRALLAAGPPRAQQLRAIDLAVSGGAFADLDRPLLGRCRTEAVTLLLAHDTTLGHAREGRRVAPLVGASPGLRGDDCQGHGRQPCEFGPENALNDADPRYVIKLESERKLNCRQQAQDPSRGIQISRRLNHGKATTASGSVPEMRCRGRTHHRSVRIAADSVSALRRLRPHVGDARVGVVGPLARMPGQRSSPSGGGSTIGRCAAFRSLSSSWRLRPVGRRGLPSHFTVTGLSAP